MLPSTQIPPTHPPETAVDPDTLAVRSLKVQPTFDQKGSSLLLKGQWLSVFGFPPGARVEVTCVKAGEISVRLAPGQVLMPHFRVTKILRPPASSSSVYTSRKAKRRVARASLATAPFKVP